jgi:phosphoadenosine phosphosulfate reductase
MKKDTVKSVSDKMNNASAEDVLLWTLSEFNNDRLAFASSLGAEDQVLTHMIHANNLDIPIFTIDTGCLYSESHRLIEQVEKKYGFQFEILKPDGAAAQEMVNAYGEDLYYKSLELRKKCCYVRKIEPLKKKLTNLDAWICGLRCEQSVTRKNLEKVEWDEAFVVIKINPLADWTKKQVWDYIKENEIPYHELHDKGYPSIGCAPCTRAIKVGEGVRAGRWWWENKEYKECGLHQRAEKKIEKDKEWIH